MMSRHFMGQSQSTKALGRVAYYLANCANILTNDIVLHTTFWLSVSGDLPVVPGASYMPFEQASAARLPGILATGGEAEDTSRPW